ncbi:MAG: hypothetical protein M1376_24460, partial [Planctomycetes bacterium]|nr:hypothetical protein [Planctomycetota bacterium]
ASADVDEDVDDVIAGRVGSEELELSYLGQMALPWKLDPPWSYLWLLLEAAAFGYALWRREVRALVFAAIAVLIVLPVVPFRGLNTRYLYLPMMASAVGAALVLEFGLTVLAQLRSPKVLRLAGGAVLAALVVFAMVNGSLATSSYGEDVAGVARETRLQFRPIFQAHASFPPDTLLYFFNQPFTTPNISGLMFLRYGANVSVSGSDIDRPVGLRDHKSAYVYYLDGQNVMREAPVSPAASVRTDPALPVRFEDGISLTGCEVVDTRTQAGGSIDLILYWETSKKLDKDYTVFAHLVGAAGGAGTAGNVVAGYDSQPKEGHAPTSGWTPNSTVVDTIVLPISPDVPVGAGYRVRVGLYYLPTMQRLAVLGASGAPAGDAVALDSFEIVAK